MSKAYRLFVLGGTCAAMVFFFGYMALYHMTTAVEGVDQHGAIFVYSLFTGIFLTVFGVVISRDEYDEDKKQR